MGFDRHLIAPFNSGLQNNLRPWLIPEDAFEQMDNAYVFRGRVKKRFGSLYMGSGSNIASASLSSRLRFQVGTTNGSGNLSGTISSNVYTAGTIGQIFSVGASPPEIMTIVTAGVAQPMLTTGSSIVHTFDTTNGNFVIQNAAINSPVYFYPSLPVMGLANYISGPINDQPSYAFDTRYAYVFSGGAWSRSGSGSNPIWHGTNINFFWTANWRGATDSVLVMFVSNFNATVGAPGATDDPLWYTTDGSTWTSWTPRFAPAGGTPTSGPFIQTARIILPFKDRLVLLNTIENDGGSMGGTNSAYVNRARFSHNGSPLSSVAFYEPNQTDNAGGIADGGGFVDAYTDEQIISAEFIKDRLIVFFERSTWELAYTGNQVLPFVWQKINTELGCEAQLSTVPFDKHILAIGNVGVHACNGSNVERIDNKIPDNIFQIQDNNLGPQRVVGIRDYKPELVYWTFPIFNQNPDEVYPTKVMVYNYRNDTWAFNDDCITCFGYFEQQSGVTWNSTILTWEQYQAQWNSGIEAPEFRQVIAGNQQGYVYIIDSELDSNAPVMQITNMTTDGLITTLTVIDHTLQNANGIYGDYIALFNTTGAAFVPTQQCPYNIYPVTYVNTNTITIPVTFTGTYKGGGLISRISNIRIKSKQWNPYVDQGVNVYLARIDFGVVRTSGGEVTVDYFASSSGNSLIEDGGPLGTNAMMGNNVLETYPYDPVLAPLESTQRLLWHPIYFESTGECIQIHIYMAPDATQLMNPVPAYSDFQLEGMVLHTMPSSSRLQ